MSDMTDRLDEAMARAICGEPLSSAVSLREALAVVSIRKARAARRAMLEESQ